MTEDNYRLQKAEKRNSYFGMEYIATGHETGGKYFLSEAEIPAKDNSTPLHIHAKEDESFLITGGELTFEIDGKPETLKKGDYLTIKKGTKHRFYNHTGEKAVMLILFSPAGIEEMFREFEKEGVDELAEDEVWQRPNNASNSVANLILHLCGNITQYIISALGNEEDKRTRDEEFAAREGAGKAELFDKLEHTLVKASSVINNATGEDLMKAYSVQGFSYTGIGIIIHVVEHYSYHTGQIAFWTKLLKGKDLGFYANIDLNVRNRH